MNAHPAGPKHAEQLHAPGLPERPTDATAFAALAPEVWPRNAERGPDGVVRLAGIPVTELAATYGTPLFVVDEDDFRSRCRDMARAFGPSAKVHYASKAFLCGEIARWVADEGCRSTSPRAVNWRLRCMQGSRRSESPCTATTSRSPNFRRQ